MKKKKFSCAYGEARRKKQEDLINNYNNIKKKTLEKEKEEKGLFKIIKINIMIIQVLKSLKKKKIINKKMKLIKNLI